MPKKEWKKKELKFFKELDIESATIEELNELIDYINDTGADPDFYTKRQYRNVFPYIDEIWRGIHKKMTQNGRIKLADKIKDNKHIKKPKREKDENIS